MLGSNTTGLIPYLLCGILAGGIFSFFINYLYKKNPCVAAKCSAGLGLLMIFFIIISVAAALFLIGKLIISLVAYYFF